MTLRGRAARSVALILLVASRPLAAQASAGEDAPALTALGKDVYLARTPFGNSVIALGREHGWAIVGPQSTAQLPALRRELAARSPLPVRFVFVNASPAIERNRDAGWGALGAVVIAEEHAAYRMSQGLQADYPHNDAPRSAPSTPSLGFSEVQQIHLDGQDIHIVRQKPGNSNADVSAHFESAGVIYLGNAFIADGYPTVDEAHGGDFGGLVETSAKFMTWDAKTRFVPGRGELSSPADLRAYHDMLVGVRDRVQKLKRAGKSLDAIIAAHPTAPYDARWGTKDPGAANALVTAAYHSLSAPRAPKK